MLLRNVCGLGALMAVLATGACVPKQGYPSVYCVVIEAGEDHDDELQASFDAHARSRGLHLETRSPGGHMAYEAGAAVAAERYHIDFSKMGAVEGPTIEVFAFEPGAADQEIVALQRFVKAEVAPYWRAQPCSAYPGRGPSMSYR